MSTASEGTTKCEDCAPTTESAPRPEEDVMDPKTFVKPDLLREVRVVIEYCNRWWAILSRACLCLKLTLSAPLQSLVSFCVHARA